MPESAQFGTGSIATEYFMTYSETSPLIGVIMPVYNGERYLREAVDSVLSQNFQRFELIIIDDGSEDSTANILRSYSDSRLKVVTHPQNRGRVAAFRTGVETVGTPYLSFIGADDIAERQWLQEVWRCLQEDPGVDAASCALQRIDSDGIPFGEPSTPLADNDDIVAALLFSPSVSQGGAILRTDALRKVGYDGPFDVASDYSMWTRLALAGCKFRNTDMPLMRYRRHDRQTIRVESDTVRVAHVEIRKRFIAGLWPDIGDSERSDLMTWLAWRHAGRSSGSVRSREVMNRSLRVSKWLQENPPLFIPMNIFSAWRRVVIDQELVAWGGIASLREVYRARAELTARELMRCAARSVLGR